MKIYGFQKMTMLDFPGKVACTVFVAGCNFRCPFCHNAPLVTKIEPNGIDEIEILGYLEKRKGIIDGVCITGGEPLLYDGTDDFIKRVKDMGYDVKLDTNGFFPKRLRSLAQRGLVDYVAMDIKNSKEKYGQAAGVAQLDLFPIEESVSFLLSDTVDYEFRTTVVKELHQLEDIKKIGEWIKGAKRYYLQKFVDSGCLISDGFHAVSEEDMLRFAVEARRFVPSVELRGI